MKRTKAYRRHHRERKKKYALKVMRQSWLMYEEFTGFDGFKVSLKDWANRYTDNLKRCSCDMCSPGNYEKFPDRRKYREYLHSGYQDYLDEKLIEDT